MPGSIGKRSVVSVGWGVATALSLLLVGPRMAPAQSMAPAPSDTERARDDEITALRDQLQVVASELERLRTQIAVPEEPELESTHGFGPAASKVYGVGRGISLGGYAEGVYTSQIGDADGNGRDQADFIRLVLYTGYKFSPKWLFNAEIEFEHATTSGIGDDGSVSVEFASLEYLHSPELSFRGGLLLVPMGFVNEIHEPPFFYGNSRPEAEQKIIPSTWRENGFGVFGNLGERLSYRAYVMNGLDATQFSASGLRSGRQKGERARADDLAFVGRVDFDPCPGCRIGGSYYAGNSGQDQSGVPDVFTRIWELHGQLERGPLHLRALYTEAHLDDALDLSGFLGGTPIASRMVGGYGEIAYDVSEHIWPGSERTLAPFFRWEYLDTQHDLPSGMARDRGQPRRLFVPGIQFKPIPNVVLKLDYRNIDSWSGNAADELRLGMGLVF